MNSSFSRVFRPQIFRLAAVMLVALALLSLVFFHKKPTTAAEAHEIHVAALAGNLEKVKALLKEHPDLVFSNDAGGLPLDWAAARGHRDVMELLLAYGAKFKDNVLFVAAIHGQKDAVEELLAHGADVNVTNYHAPRCF